VPIQNPSLQFEDSNSFCLSWSRVPDQDIRYHYSQTVTLPGQGYGLARARNERTGG
jgi:hypothetical protein